MIHVALRTDKSRKQSFLLHFEREDGDALRVAAIGGDMQGDVERQRGFAHGGTGGQNDQFAGTHAAGHLVVTIEAGAGALHAMGRVQEGVDAALSGVEDLLGADQSVVALRLSELEEGIFGRGENRLRVVLAQEAALGDFARSEDHLAQHRLAFDDLHVALDVEDLGQTVFERNHVAQAVHRFELGVAHQLVGYGDVIDLVAAGLEVQHAAKDTAMLVETEIVSIQTRCDRYELLVIEKD